MDEETSARLVANRNSNNLSILYGVGDGTFTPESTFSSGDYWSLAKGDFNDDGLTDLAAVNLAGDSVSVLLNQGFCVLLGDVNQDGEITLLDVAPFVALLNNVGFQTEADVNQDGAVNLLDVTPFIELLSGG